jgi:hypothetical protein
MFFPDPLQGLREIHRALRPGGGVCTMVFSRPEKNPCLTILMATALKHAGLPARDPLRRRRVAQSGPAGPPRRPLQVGRVRDVATTAVEAVFRVPSVDHYLPSSAVRRPDPADPRPARCGCGRRGLERDAGALDDLQHAGRMGGPNELLLTAGRRPRETA